MVCKIKDETIRALSGWNLLELQQITKELKNQASHKKMQSSEHKKIQRASLIGEQLKSLSNGSFDLKGGVTQEAKRLFELAKQLSRSCLMSIELGVQEVGHTQPSLSTSLF